MEVKHILSGQNDADDLNATSIACNHNNNNVKHLPIQCCQATGNNDNTAQSITRATKVRRKSPASLATVETRTAIALKRSQWRIPLTQLLWLLCGLSLAHNSMADCPSVCECKWKSGKESVLCLNANLTHIPAPLDIGTQVLDLSGNDMQVIPHDTFAAVNLLNLQKVYLAKCRLKTIERYAFRKLINLVELDLSYNQLTSIPDQAFENITELRDLKLNGNPLTRVQDNAFRHVEKLVRLELSDCRISVVEVRAFAGLENTLEWLKLDGNRLSEVRAGTITSLTNLHGIELARNIWNCSCALRPLRVWMLEKNIPCSIPPLCRAPARLAGKTWDKIDLDEFACVPQIIATDTTAHGVEGRNVTMSCFVEGVPEPSVRWLVKNRVIANLTASGDSATANSPRTAAATQGRKTYVVNMLRNASNLTILTADMQDAGIYTCAAENKAGKVEASVTLAVSRRPPDAPLGLKIVLLCVVTALLFVIGSSFAAICLCSLRRKRKMRLWNTVPAARTDSYEKIEMQARGACNANARERRGGGDGNDKPDLGGGVGYLHGGTDGIAMGMGCAREENDYLRGATMADEGADIGVAMVNPSGGGGAKRNGDYLNIPTHCDDDGYDDNSEHSLMAMRQRTSSLSCSVMSTSGGSAGGGSTNRWHAAAGLHKSPQEINKRKYTTNAGIATATTAATTTTAATPSTGTCLPTNNATLLEDNDLHIPRLIDIGSESASSSISSKVDAASRLAGYTHTPTAAWSASTTNTIATTKINSPHSQYSEFQHRTKPNSSAIAASNYYNNNDDVNKSVFCNNDNDTQIEHDLLFDSNYPDLLDIAKYAVAQVKNANAVAQLVATTATAGATPTTPSTLAATNGSLCTLPRKLKNTGKYFKNSTDSQSPLLADNSSKYGSSTLGDVAFINELALGRRFSAESTYSNYAATATYTSGQRSNSYLNLVQSTHKSTPSSNNNNHKNSSSNNNNSSMSTSLGGVSASVALSVAAQMQRRNPSLPSSPVHELPQQKQQSLQLALQQQLQQHQRSFSTAATPLLDFSALATRATGMPMSGLSTAAHTTTACSTSTTGVATTTTSTPVTAYDYHAAQLERFLEEYRSLQDQLCKMKETCETIRKKDAPMRVGVGHAAALADPVMFNAAMATPSPTANARTPTLKTKTILPGQPPDPPPYWLHRNALLKRLNEQQNDIFKS